MFSTWQPTYQSSPCSTQRIAIGIRCTNGCASHVMCRTKLQPTISIDFHWTLAVRLRIQMLSHETSSGFCMHFEMHFLCFSLAPCPLSADVLRTRRLPGANCICNFCASARKRKNEIRPFLCFLRILSFVFASVHFIVQFHAINHVRRVARILFSIICYKYAHTMRHNDAINTVFTIDEVWRRPTSNDGIVRSLIAIFTDFSERNQCENNANKTEFIVYY